MATCTDTVHVAMCVCVFMFKRLAHAHIIWHRHKLQHIVHQSYSARQWGGDINQAKSREAAFVCAHTHLIVYTRKDLFV